MSWERSNIEFPMWRKKVDGSLFQYKVTTIPNHYVQLWKMDKFFKDVNSKTNKRSKVAIYFNEKQKKYKFEGFLTVAKNKRATPAYRLWFGDDLLDKIRSEYQMSYLRYMEGYVRRIKSGTEVKNHEIEKEIPFWEFLDIEYDHKKREFHLQNSYSQPSQFPELFSFLSKLLSAIEIDSTKLGEKVIFGKWMNKKEFIDNYSIKNMIYYLYSSQKKELYIGETRDSHKRGFENRHEIKDWDMARFDILPKALTPYRVEIEKILIKAFSYFFENNHEKENLKVKILKNKKIKKI